MDTSRRSFLGMAAFAAAAGNIPLKNVKMPALGGGKVMCFANRGHSQMSSTVFVSPKGRLAVVDGGYFDDGPFLWTKIQELGGVVDIWFITHPHSDHYGALDWILRNGRCEGVTVKSLCFNFPPLEWVAANEPRSGELTGRFLDILAKYPQIPVKKLAKGDSFDLDGISFETLNEPYLIGKRDSVNNSSICFSVKMGSKKLLVTGDTAADSARCIMRDVPAEKLKSDIVFMAHHGQQGAQKDFYAAVTPQIAIWPTPDWLWENDIGKGPGSGPFHTNYTKCWLQELKVKEQYVLTKDVILG